MERVEIYTGNGYSKAALWVFDRLLHAGRIVRIKKRWILID